MNFDIKERRLELGLTLEEVAAICGVGKSTVRKWENGIINNIGSGNIVALAKALKVSPLTILKDEYQADEEEHYYYNEETRKIAQEIFDNRELRILFDASRKAKPEDLEFVAEMIKKFKKQE